MYAPSSYNETVNGETLSSISEKSGTYSHPENHDEYLVKIRIVMTFSTPYFPFWKARSEKRMRS
jgi:hypothetical protein